MYGDGGTSLFNKAILLIRNYKEIFVRNIIATGRRKKVVIPDAFRRGKPFSLCPREMKQYIHKGDMNYHNTHEDRYGNGTNQPQVLPRASFYNGVDCGSTVECIEHLNQYHCEEYHSLGPYQLHPAQI